MPTTVGCKSPETRQRRFYATAEESCPNLENWGQDSLRHSYASYYYALNKNAHETAEQMGHMGGLRIFSVTIGTGFVRKRHANFGRFVPLRVRG
jgi:hypothetical protein